MALLARSLAVVLVACSPTLPDGEIGCSDGRCPNGYTCGPDARCYIFSSLDADGIPDVFGIDASDAATDATSGPVLTPAWMMTFGGTGADEALGSTLVGSDLVVVGYLSPDAFFDGDPLSVPQNEQGFVAQLTLDGTVGEVSQWAATNVTRLADVASDGSRIFVAGSWNGELEDGTASSGFRSGWIGQLDEDFATISIWSGAGTQIATAIAHEDDQLIAGGFAAGELTIEGSFSEMTSDEDGVVVQMQATGALVTARRISGSGEGGDRVEAVAFNTTGTRSYAAGRVVSPTGFDAYTLDLIDDRMDTRSSSGGLVVAKSLVSPSPTEICEAGHYQGEIDLGEGVMRRADGEASYVRCSAGTTLSWLRPFDGPGSDRITSLAIGGGVMVAAGDFSSDLDLGFGTRTAIDQDAFIVVMDPFTGELIADAVFGGNGDVVVRAVEARAMGDQTRIYVVGSFESELDAFASSPVQIALGESDGFIAAFDLIR